MESSNPTFDFGNDFDFLGTENMPETSPEVEEQTENARFPNLSEQDLQKDLDNKQSSKTKKTTNWCVSTFKGRIYSVV
jgi:hypothetical protein